MKYLIMLIKKNNKWVVDKDSEHHLNGKIIELKVSQINIIKDKK